MASAAANTRHTYRYHLLFVLTAIHLSFFSSSCISIEGQNLHVSYDFGTSFISINVKNFHGSLTTVVRAQNDTTKTANITDTIFDRTLV